MGSLGSVGVVPKGRWDHWIALRLTTTGEVINEYRRDGLRREGRVAWRNVSGREKIAG
ncbi:hypothetical protein DPMN_145819 [Dreissena polymorpha]|uniref:Uncharacterized protein n=1 Tax=Dreissena polymorpha TaxID=45954 RepID=A0A9D4F4T1_DREPO|nr:hypothetical protein DPMN_145819 [Dreissena polymorpha]